jgi:hypothetical protein
VASLTTDWLPSITWMRPLPSWVTETWPYWLSSSRIWSRLSSRSLGLWPPSRAVSIARLSWASWLAADWIGPVAPVIWVNSLCASVAALPMSVASVLNASASVRAADSTACLEPSDSGWLARSLHAVKNLPSSASIPVSEGSPSALCTRSRASAVVLASPSAMLWARTWRSRNESRMRR